MLHLDHLTVIAPSLVAGVEHVRQCLDVDIPYGGTHPEMGTHNHLLRLDDLYLEVIAVDPAAPSPAGPRWFGLGDATAVRSAWDMGLRLRGWVARTGDIDAVLSRHADLLGGKTMVSRSGSRSRFSLLPDGSLPGDGALPSVIERVARESPTATMEDHGARLLDFALEHPSAPDIRALYDRLGIVRPPVLRDGPAARYVATIETPSGPRTLT